ncbi:MAG: hypothetical protein GY810_13980 [Aureispira sp.]|nr:hypothetical protein [Aureispira sp.]
MIPRTFEEWKRCIEKDCKIQLTPAFAKQRLSVYEDNNHKETQQFLELYGKQYLENIIRWFKQI